MSRSGVGPCANWSGQQAAQAGYLHEQVSHLHGFVSHRVRFHFDNFPRFHGWLLWPKHNNILWYHRYTNSASDPKISIAHHASIFPRRPENGIFASLRCPRHPPRLRFAKTAALTPRPFQLVPQTKSRCVTSSRTICSGYEVHACASGPPQMGVRSTPRLSA
jgi:hypothetical protein